MELNIKIKKEDLNYAVEVFLFNYGLGILLIILVNLSKS